VDVLATFNLGNESFAGLGEPSYHEVLPPLVLHVVRPTWTFSGTDTDKHTQISAWPFIEYSLIENLRCRVVLASSLVHED